MSRPHLRPPYRNYSKGKIVFLPIFIEIDEAKEANNIHFITDYCKEHRVNPKTLRNKYNRWKDAGSPAIHQNGVEDGLSSARGANNRSFSIAEENELAQYIKDEFIEHHIPIALSDMSLLALEKWHTLHTMETRATQHPFSGSMYWCSTFAHKHTLSYRRVGHHRVPKNPADEIQREQFVEKCKAALTKYGADFVLNLDETFWKVVNVVLATWAIRGDPSPYVEHHGDEKSGVTAALLVTSSGKKLKTTVITKGTTAVSLNKLKLERFGSSIEGQYHTTAWMTADRLVKIIDDIIAPYLRGRAGALVLDTVKCHTREAVKTALAKHNIEALWVPVGCTGTLQPLDVGVFGPMKSHIRSQWRKKRLLNITYKPTYADAMAILHQSLTVIKPLTIRNAWKNALHLPLDPTSKNYKAPLPPQSPPRERGITLGDRVHRPSGNTWNQQPAEEPVTIQQQLSNESKEPISDIEKKKQDAAAVLASIPLQQPKWISSYSQADTEQLMNTQRYGKKQKIAK